jgi:hypothetical protein
MYKMVILEGVDRMWTPKLAIAILTVSLLAVSWLPGFPQQRLQANSVVPMQLKGLKSVTVVVTYVDLDFPKPKGIEEQMESAAIRLLSKTSISHEGEQGAFLCITAIVYLIEEAAFSDYVMVHVQTILCDEARLVRDPSLPNPHGYVTWSRDWVFLSRRDRIKEGVLETVNDQVESFCSGVRTAARF